MKGPVTGAPSEGLRHGPRATALTSRSSPRTPGFNPLLLLLHRKKKKASLRLSHNKIPESLLSQPAPGQEHGSPVSSSAGTPSSRKADLKASGPVPCI